ncbi:MAG: cytidylate kinase-like family protein [Pseudomonadota bacterium]
MAQTIALAISRQVASGGEPIGRLLAQRLGITFLNRSLLRDTARHLRQDPQALRPREERPAGFWSNLLSMFAVGSPPTTGSTTPVPPYVSDQDLFETEAQIIREVAGRRDIVLVGRGGYSVLAEHPGLVSVFIMAPREKRAQALRQGLRLASQEEALAVVDTCDRERGQFLESLTGRRWSEATNYHLCLDTGRLDHASAADMIITMVEKTRQGQGD